MSSLLGILTLLTVLSSPGNCVGPDLRARARLLRDLPMGLQGWYSRIPPRKESETLIDMSLAVRSVDLDFATGTFTVKGWMSLRWKDARYVWNPADYEGIESVTLPFSKVWAPEVILHNAAEDKFIYRQVGMVKHRGEFVFIISVHTKSGCEPNFENFPFGLQSCHLKFGSWVNNDYNVQYRISANETVELGDFTSPSGWKIVTSDVHLESKQYPLFEEPSHAVVYDFVIKKDFYFDGETRKLQREGD